MQQAKTALGLAMTICCVGCSAPYWQDRLLDAGDTLTFTVGPGVGAKAGAGPLCVNSGFLYHVDMSGLRYGDFVGRSEKEDHEWGILFAFTETWHYPSPLQQQRGKKLEHIRMDDELPFLQLPGPDREKLEGIYMLSQIEAIAGLGISARLGANPFELLDFLLGWTTLDIASDDYFSENPPPEPEPEPVVFP